MTRPAVVHTTPTLLDMRALTVMGLSAKPNTKSPIGMFGTGLKYAVATLCRLGCSPVIWIGRDRYTFAGRKGEFRDAVYTHIRARLDRPTLLKPRYEKLPFTTEYGKFWTPWMAFRELEANTRDEIGGTECVEDGAAVQGAPNCTSIVVDLPAYVQCWRDRDEIFLPDAIRNSTGLGPQVQVMASGPRDKLYWRGLRVMELTKPAVRTWNILRDLELTEDRTLKYEFYARAAVAKFVSESDDAQLIEDVITADDKRWEHRLEWSAYGGVPSETFKAVALRCKGRAAGVWGYVSAHMPTAPGPRVTEWDKAKRPWFLDDDSEPSTIHDANGRVLCQRPESFDAGEWLLLTRELLRRVNADPTPATAEFATVEPIDDEVPF